MVCDPTASAASLITAVPLLKVTGLPNAAIDLELDAPRGVLPPGMLVLATVAVNATGRPTLDALAVKTTARWLWSRRGDRLVEGTEVLAAKLLLAGWKRP